MRRLNRNLCIPTYDRLNKLSTQIVLTSRTPADPDALSTLFSGRIHPESDVYRVASKISSIVDTPPRYLSEEELERAIVSVINSDDLVRVQFMEIFHEKRLRKMLTFDDYKRFCHASLIAASIKSSRVFISYAAKDQKIAEELREALAIARRGIIAFMASRDVKGGDLWEPSIREAIVACSEMLVVITPNSKDRPWIMIEVGAGWALGKHVTPCLAFVDVSEVPEALSRSQARSILTKKDRDALIKELSNRLGISKKSQVASRS